MAYLYRYAIPLSLRHIGLLWEALIHCSSVAGTCELGTNAVADTILEASAIIGRSVVTEANLIGGSSPDGIYLFFRQAVIQDFQKECVHP